MSRGINKVIIVGNVTQEPDCRFMPNGNQVVSLTIATNEIWSDKATGEKKEKAEFHRVVFFGKIAEIVGQYVHKGSKLYVEGRLVTRKWTDQQGIERYTTEVVVDMNGTMQMLDSRQDHLISNRHRKADRSRINKRLHLTITNSTMISRSPNITQSMEFNSINLFSCKVIFTVRKFIMH